MLAIWSRKYKVKTKKVHGIFLWISVVFQVSDIHNERLSHITAAQASVGCPMRALLKHLSSTAPPPESSLHVILWANFSSSLYGPNFLLISFHFELKTLTSCVIQTFRVCLGSNTIFIEKFEGHDFTISRLYQKSGNVFTSRKKRQKHSLSRLQFHRTHFNTLLLFGINCDNMVLLLYIMTNQSCSAGKVS